MQRFGGTEVYDGGLTVYTHPRSRPAAGRRDRRSSSSCARSRRRRPCSTGATLRRRTCAATRRMRRARPTRYLQGALVALEPQNGAIRAHGRRPELRREQLQPSGPGAPPAGQRLQADRLRRGAPHGAIVRTASSRTRRSRSAGATRSWSPQNFDRKFRGPVTLRYALQKSINVPSIRLLEAVGPKNVVELAHQLGIAEPIAPHLSLALGTAEVTPLELTSAYSCFANHGILAQSPRRRADRGPLRPRARRVPAGLPRGARREDQLPDGQPDALGHRPRDRLAGSRQDGFDAPAAGKTGTTDDYTDAWFVGFIPRLRLRGLGGIRREADDRPQDDRRSRRPPRLGRLHEPGRAALYGSEEFAAARPGSSPSITCTDSGLLAAPGCPKVVSDAFEPGQAPAATCAVHAGLPAARRTAPDEGRRSPTTKRPRRRLPPRRRRPRPSPIPQARDRTPSARRSRAAKAARPRRARRSARPTAAARVRRLDLRTGLGATLRQVQLHDRVAGVDPRARPRAGPPGRLAGRRDRRP